MNIVLTINHSYIKQIQLKLNMYPFFKSKKRKEKGSQGVCMFLHSPSVKSEHTDPIQI